MTFGGGWFSGFARKPAWCLTGLRLTAGWAQQPWFQAPFGSKSSAAVLLVTLQKRPPEGAVGRCPAALRALIPGK